MDLFLQKFAEAVNLKPGDVSPGQKLRDLPTWDSLAILTTLSMLDQEYNLRLSGTELQACDTVDDLYNKVPPARKGVHDH